MSERRPFVGGNWKMNTDLASAVELAEDIVAGLGDIDLKSDVVLFPPYPYLQAVGRAVGHHAVMVGGQDVSAQSNGAWTGQVSTSMLLDLGARWAIIGHSERRHGLGEADALIGRKVSRALQSGLSVVLCCGETEQERHGGQTDAVTQRQLRAALEGLEAGALKSLVIAYEPVWAIGTGLTPSLSDAESVHREIRNLLASLYDSGLASSIRIIYGGSMKPANAAELIGSPEIDGGLIGGASLEADDFLAICRAAAG